MAAALPAAAQAQSDGPTPSRGKAELVTSVKGNPTASFLANRSLDVEVTYRRRSSSTRTVRLAGRFRVSGRRCPSRPSSADRRRLGVATRNGRRSSYFTARGTARFKVGTNRVCVWAKEGSRGYRRLPQIRERFARSLFALTSAEGTNVGMAVTAYQAASSAPLAGVRVVEGIGPRSTCRVDEEPATSVEHAGIFRSGLSHATAAPCTRLAASVTSTAGSGVVAAGPTAVGAPTRVVQHIGDCNPEITRSVPVLGANASTFMAAAGCKLGRVISGTSEGRKRAGLPAAGDIFMVRYRGRAVSVAPAGTTVDVVVDDRR
ncbi:MAG: hypothetical protein ITG02_01550 [Patulibacter sp.]|nr:hypothetical protein [Patulibacter sp.]